MLRLLQIGLLQLKTDGSPGEDDHASIVSAFEITEVADNLQLFTFPNPMENRITFKVNNGEKLNVVNIYSLNGAKVAELSDAYNNEIHWNGCNQLGVQLKGGIYIYQALIGDEKVKLVSGKIMKH